MSAFVSRRLILASSGALALTGCGEDWKKHRYGIVELGAGGPKWVVLEFRERDVTAGAANPNDREVMRYVRYRRQEIESGDFDADVMNLDAIPEVVSRVGDAARSLTQFGVGARQRVFVASSSVASLPPTHLQALREALSNEDIDLEIVNAQQEAEYAFRWIVPTNDRERASFIDIGSGNVKGGQINPTTGEFSGFDIPAGAATIMRAAEAAAAEPGQTLTVAQLIAREVENQIKPELERRADAGLANPVMYLGGGSVWAMRAISYPEVPVDRTWVPLNAADIIRYRDTLRADPTLATLLADLPRQSPVRDMIGAVKEVIPQPHRLLAGAEILAMMSEVLDLSSAQTFFANEAQFAWSTMYLLWRLRIERQASGARG